MPLGFFDEMFGHRHEDSVTAPTAGLSTRWHDRRSRNYPTGSEAGAAMTTVGIVGSGMIGGIVARLSVAAGHHVVLSNSRSLQGWQDTGSTVGASGSLR